LFIDWSWERCIPVAWWLAATSRWRTATRCFVSPDHACFLQSHQKAKQSRRNPLCFDLGGPKQGGIEATAPSNLSKSAGAARRFASI